MRRRDLITLLGGAAAGWPAAARAQQGERMRRIAVLLPATADDTNYQTWFGAFLQGLQKSGWTHRPNVQVDTRWATANPDAVRRNAGGIGCSRARCHIGRWRFHSWPVAEGNPHCADCIRGPSLDPVGAGFVDSLARPGGNATGFMAFEYSISAKWLELLKQMAPTVTRVAVLRDSTTTSGIGQFGVIQAMAPSLRVEVSHVNEHDATEIERAVTAFARSSNGGLIITASGLALFIAT